MSSSVLQYYNTQRYGHGLHWTVGVGTLLGGIDSEARRQAARQNGKKGGAPSRYATTPAPKQDARGRSLPKKLDGDLTSAEPSPPEIKPAGEDFTVAMPADFIAPTPILRTRFV